MKTLSDAAVLVENGSTSSWMKRLVATSGFKGRDGRRLEGHHAARMGRRGRGRKEGHAARGPMTPMRCTSRMTTTAAAVDPHAWQDPEEQHHLCEEHCRRSFRRRSVHKAVRGERQGARGANSRRSTPASAAAFGTLPPEPRRIVISYGTSAISAAPMASPSSRLRPSRPKRGPRLPPWRRCPQGQGREHPGCFRREHLRPAPHRADRPRDRRQGRRRTLVRRAVAARWPGIDLCEDVQNRTSSTFSPP